MPRYTVWAAEKWFRQMRHIAAPSQQEAIDKAALLTDWDYGNPEYSTDLPTHDWEAHEESN